MHEWRKNEWVKEGRKEGKKELMNELYLKRGLVLVWLCFSQRPTFHPYSPSRFQLLSGYSIRINHPESWVRIPSRALVFSGFPFAANNVSCSTSTKDLLGGNNYNLQLVFKLAVPKMLWTNTSWAFGNMYVWEFLLESLNPFLMKKNGGD